MIIIVMGVAGSGKTTVGSKLAAMLGCKFYDADDFHPQENIDKMASGLPLEDKDRYPWLVELNRRMHIWKEQGDAVLACSALKEDYRDILKKGIPALTWVFLSGSKSLILERMNKRDNHFMKSNMLDSQFDILEVPSYAIEVSIDQPTNELVNKICENLKL